MATTTKATLPARAEKKLPVPVDTADQQPRPDGHAQLSAQELRRMTSDAAYYRAERRGFVPGAELDDWLAAEAEIRALAQTAL